MCTWHIFTYNVTKTSNLDHMPTIFVHIQQRKKRLALHIKSHLYVTYIVTSLGTKTSKRDHMPTITSRMQQSKTNLARCVAVTTAAYMLFSHARHKGITAPGTLMTTALQMQLDELPTAILSVGGVCGKPRQIAQRLTASRDRSMLLPGRRKSARHSWTSGPTIATKPAMPASECFASKSHGILADS